MKIVTPLLIAGTCALGASGLSFFFCPGGCPASDADRVEGTYVEGRSAAVFAGACHVNGEVDHQGRHALVGWRIERGSWAGQDLAGVEIAAAVSSSDNLSRSGARRARVWIDAASEAQGEAALAWLRERQSETLGEVCAVEAGEVELALEGESYRLTAGDQLTLAGVLEPDRACCTMPEEVWYTPLARVDDAIVGNSAECRFAGVGEDVPWSYPGQNNAFVASFEDAPAPEAAREVLPCCAELLGEAGPEEATLEQ